MTKILESLSFDDIVDETRPLETQTNEKAETDTETDTEDTSEDVDDVDSTNASTQEDTVEDDDSESIYSSLNKTFGYDIEGEFDETVDGIAEYTKQVAVKMAESEVQQLFEAYPDVKEYLDFRLKNGDPKAFFEKSFNDVDYASLTIDEDNESLQEKIVKEDLKKQGYSSDEIEEFVSDYKDSGLLYKMSNKSVKKLVEYQKKEKETLIQEQTKLEQQRQEETKKMVNSIETVIEKGDLKNIIIPESKRKNFKEWLLKPDTSGKTQREKQLESLSWEEKLQLEYMMFSGFNLKDLVQKEARKLNIDRLKEKSKANQTPRLAGSGKNQKPTTEKGQNPYEGLSFDSLIN
jgi:hypothetical protein